MRVSHECWQRCHSQCAELYVDIAQCLLQLSHYIAAQKCVEFALEHVYEMSIRVQLFQQRLLAMGCQRRAPEAGAGVETVLEQVQGELELVDHDIDTRYFAIAALAAVHL